MFHLNITPRFNDTDALGHINNASVVTWFENARRPIFKLFIPSLSPKDWNLILARVEVDYIAQLNYMDEITIKTWFETIGNSSMVIVQEAWQGETLGARGKSVMVHFDYKTNKSAPIPDDLKKKLTEHLSPHQHC